MEPLGRHGAEVRRLRALRHDAAARRTEGVFLAEGLHLAREALACGSRIELAVAAPRLEADPRGRALLEALLRAGVELRRASDRVLDGLQDARSPQPLLLVCRREPVSLDSLLDRAEPGPVVVAHGLQDPGNLGAVARTADAAGARGLLVTGTGVDPFHPRAVRATMGAVFRLPLLAAQPAGVVGAFAARELALLAADPRGECDYRAADLAGPLALLLGGESAGLPAELLPRVTARLRIPMRQGVESLSVGAAAAVLLFEAARQREARSGARS